MDQASRTHSVVELTAPGLGDELVTELTDLGVHDKTLEVNVSEPGNGAMVLSARAKREGAGQRRDVQAGGIVAATALEADEAVLDNVNAADTVVVTNLVQEFEQLQAVGGLLLVLGDNLDGDALLKVDLELVGLVGRVDGVKGAAVVHVNAGHLSRTGFG